MIDAYFVFPVRRAIAICDADIAPEVAASAKWVCVSRKRPVPKSSLARWLVMRRWVRIQLFIETVPSFP